VKQQHYPCGSGGGGRVNIKACRLLYERPIASSRCTPNLGEVVAHAEHGESTQEKVNSSVISFSAINFRTSPKSLYVDMAYHTATQTLQGH
jgi:hypothetical protein